MKSKEQKRMEAKVRQEAFSKLSRTAKLGQILSRPGNSAREMKKFLQEV